MFLEREWGEATGDKKLTIDELGKSVLMFIPILSTFYIEISKIKQKRNKILAWVVK